MKREERKRGASAMQKSLRSRIRCRKCAEARCWDYRLAPECQAMAVARAVIHSISMCCELHVGSLVRVVLHAQCRDVRQDSLSEAADALVVAVHLVPHVFSVEKS